MTTNVLVAFYSTYGHVHRMALAVVEGAESVPDITVRLRRIAELEEALQAGLRDFGYVEGQNGSMLLDHARVAVSQIPRHDEQWRAVHHRQAAVAVCPIERAARSSAFLLRKRAIVNSR
jgi:hypothetical protein